uniref:Uncharacterized protein n=1 Tax=Panagrolaimus sp. ES5 TaxID=591445 RepID=A0AC34F401_9BILA
MANSLIFDVPLVTKFWDIDYGTFCALPNNCRITKVIDDEDGHFNIFCTKLYDKYGNAEICFEVFNPNFEFDYVLSTVENWEAKLNKPLTTTWFMKHANRQKIREHVRNMYLSNSNSSSVTKEASNISVNAEPITKDVASAAAANKMITISLGLMTDPEFRHIFKMKYTDRFDRVFIDYGAIAGFDNPEDLIILWHIGDEYKTVKYFDTPEKLKMPLNGTVNLFFNPKRDAKRQTREDEEINIRFNIKEKDPIERFIHKEMPFKNF